MSLLVTAALLLPASPVPAARPAQENGAPPAARRDCLDFTYGPDTPGETWVQAIVVQSPALRSEVTGRVRVAFRAPGMKVARALCWQQPTRRRPDPMGHDAVVAERITLDAEGNGSFVFPADEFPNGPITLRILAHDEATKRDLRELQLFNTGGVVWNQGLPKQDPPAAKGMKLAFSDDFDGPLSISNGATPARYYSHKPGGGDFSGWPFSDVEAGVGSVNPFQRVGRTFLRIRASKGKDPGAKGSTGLISSVGRDFRGFYATAPFYMECRFTAQSAPGTWPAFWTLTKTCVQQKEKPGDELDIIEAYGGYGRGNPSSPDYRVTTHFWNQTGPDGKPRQGENRVVPMREIGSRSSWSTTFHTYGLKVTATDTLYYLDDREVLRHPTGQVSRTEPHFFLINYAIGGISGWKIDLEREGNASDMYVDYVRVYQGGGDRRSRVGGSVDDLVERPARGAGPG